MNLYIVTMHTSRSSAKDFICSSENLASVPYHRSIGLHKYINFRSVLFTAQRFIWASTISVNRQHIKTTKNKMHCLLWGGWRPSATACFCFLHTCPVTEIHCMSFWTFPLLIIYHKQTIILPIALPFITHRQALKLHQRPKSHSCGIYCKNNICIYHI